MSERTCKTTRLASDRGMAVDHCTCGHVHLTLGATTVRLNEETFSALAGVIGQASLRMAYPERPVVEMASAFPEQ